MQLTREEREAMESSMAVVEQSPRTPAMYHAAISGNMEVSGDS